ncbi:hypothetical protein AtubIFM57143_007866 [Aspergillus tubingensis]|nr:hypothetical protein AtubIFM57143_007866 [Aspergillus tubingensis]
MESPVSNHPDGAMKQYSVTEGDAMSKDGLDSTEEGPRQFDPQLHERVLRKLDYFLMPMMVVGYGLVYYDKVSMNLPRKALLTGGHLMN